MSKLTSRVFLCAAFSGMLTGNIAFAEEDGFTYQSLGSCHEDCSERYEDEKADCDSPNPFEVAACIGIVTGRYADCQKKCPK